MNITGSSEQIVNIMREGIKAQFEPYVRAELEKIAAQVVVVAVKELVAGITMNVQRTHFELDNRVVYEISINGVKIPTGAEDVK